MRELAAERARHLPFHALLGAGIGRCGNDTGDRKAQGGYSPEPQLEQAFRHMAVLPLLLVDARRRGVLLHFRAIRNPGIATTLLGAHIFCVGCRSRGERRDGHAAPQCGTTWHGAARLSKNCLAESLIADTRTMARSITTKGPSLAGGDQVEVAAQHGVELARAPAAVHVAHQRRGLAAVAAHDRVRLRPATERLGRARRGTCRPADRPAARRRAAPAPPPGRSPARRPPAPARAGRPPAPAGGARRSR